MLELYGTSLRSRLLLGTARFPSPAVLTAAVRAARAEVVTVALRRESGGERAGQGFWSIIRELGVRVLPNTAGCHSVREAVSTAHMAREVFATAWIKLEVVGEEDTLQPDVFGLTEAARILCADGFEVFPYTTEDLVVAERLLAAGCRVLMPWGAPIGSGRGLNNLFGLTALRAHFPAVPLIIDAGIGVPSHAARALELEAGCDFVHLGQGDLDGADLPALRRAGVRLGVSTHDEGELARALGLQPDYVALGPIYPTLLKAMPWPAQGLERITQWKRRIGTIPLVAVGGLTLERLPGVFAAGADVAAVVTDIVRHLNPEARVRQWLSAARAA